MPAYKIQELIWYFTSAFQVYNAFLMDTVSFEDLMANKKCLFFRLDAKWLEY